jgi:hypothetical protein
MRPSRGGRSRAEMFRDLRAELGIAD